MQRRTTVDVNPNIAGILSLFDPALDWSADLSGDEYESVLKEFLVVNQEGSKDPRKDNSLKGDEVEVIREEWQRVRKNKNLEYRVAKKKISAQKLLNSSKEAKAQSEGGGDLLVIKEKVVSIEALLGEQYRLQEENAKDAKQEAEKKRRSLKERLLEGGGKVWEGIKKVGEKVIKPFQSIWSKIIGFLQTVILGKILYSILEWGGKKENQDKIKSIFKFLKDWWPTLLTAYILFGTTFGRMATKLVVMVGRWTLSFLGLIPKLLAAIAKLKLGKILKGIPGGGKFAPLIKNTALIGGGMLLEKGLSGDFSGDSGETQNFATGGFVSGPAGVDKVPARLTAGEFVMSKGAVQKYGTNTLAAMNAVGGGTNRPTPMGRYNEGGSVTIGMDGAPGMMGPTGMMGASGMDGATEMLINMDMLGLPGLGGGGGGTNSITDKSPYLSTGKKIKNVGNMLALPFRDRTIDRDPRSNFASDIVQGFEGGGSVGFLQGMGNIFGGRTWSGESRGQIGRSVSKSRTISPSPKKEPKVIVIDESSSDNLQADIPQGEHEEIPNFDAKVIRSPRKMEVLGISV